MFWVFVRRSFLILVVGNAFSSFGQTPLQLGVGYELSSPLNSGGDVVFQHGYSFSLSRSITKSWGAYADFGLSYVSYDKEILGTEDNQYGVEVSDPGLVLVKKLPASFWAAKWEAGGQVVLAASRKSRQRGDRALGTLFIKSKSRLKRVQNLLVITNVNFGYLFNEYSYYPTTQTPSAAWNGGLSFQLKYSWSRASFGYKVGFQRFYDYFGFPTDQLNQSLLVGYHYNQWSVDLAYLEGFDLNRYSHMFDIINGDRLVLASLSYAF